MELTGKQLALLVATALTLQLVALVVFPLPFFHCWPF